MAGFHTENAQRKATSKATSKATPKKEPDKHDVFLVALEECGNISEAAKKAKLSRGTLYRKYQSDKAFAAAWEESLAIGISALEDEAKRRAYRGWEEPVWHKGEQCGTVRKFSDTLLIVLLKAHMPEKYRENLKMDLFGNIGNMSNEQLLLAIEQMEAKRKPLQG